MKAQSNSKDSQWNALARNDWSDILTLSRKKSYQTKFKIIEKFTKLVAEKGFHQVTHPELAKRCGVNRQMVDYHFPNSELLVGLAYRYIYARLQKISADSILSRQGFRNQLEAYIDESADWIQDYREDARFLIAFYGLLQSHPDLLELHERNTTIGLQRLTALCLEAKKEGFFFKGVSPGDWP